MKSHQKPKSLFYLVPEKPLRYFSCQSCSKWRGRSKDTRFHQLFYLLQPSSYFRNAVLIPAMACLFGVSGCQDNQQIKQLQQENAKLKAEVEQLQAQQHTAILATASPTPSATESPVPTPTGITQVNFEDIKGVFGEKEISQLGQLGVFDTTTGKFNPQQPITRAEFVRWLVRANNAIWFDQPDKMIHEAQGGQATFTDVPPTHPDFRYIQGVANAGIAVGYDEKTFKLDQPLTREQMIAIKIGVDKGGLEDFEKANKALVALKIGELGTAVPQWTDRNQISKRFIPAFNSQYYVLQQAGNESIVQAEDKFKNVERTFGVIKAFRPQTAVTRAEAAVCISLIGNHINNNVNAIDFRTAEQALSNSK